MSYNKQNYWINFTPPKEPGILIPEDIRALSMNKRVFPNLYFNYNTDIPKGYKISKHVRLSFDTKIPGHEPYEIKVNTTSGEANNSNASNIVQGLIVSNRKVKDGIGLNKNNMWMSKKTMNRWVDLQLEFPIAVRMNKLIISSQCGGKHHPIMAMRVEANTHGFAEVSKIEKPLADEEAVSFNEIKAKQWRLHFRPDDSGQVVIRGLRFFSSRGEFFFPKYPMYLKTKSK